MIIDEGLFVESKASSVVSTGQTSPAEVSQDGTALTIELGIEKLAIGLMSQSSTISLLAFDRGC